MPIVRFFNATNMTKPKTAPSRIPMAMNSISFDLPSSDMFAILIPYTPV